MITAAAADPSMRPNEHAPLAILLAMLVAAPAFSGCLGTAQATAGDQASTAEDRASQWSENPRMIQAVGVEGDFGSAFGGYEGDADEEASYWDRAREDPEVGDGRTEIWVYRFLSDQDPDTVFTVVVDKDGEIVATDEESRDEDDDPIGEWNVDSDEAAETAMETNAGLREGTSSENYGMVFVLQEDDDHQNPTWTVVGGGGDASGGGGVVVIDAVTGEVLSSQGGFGSPR